MASARSRSPRATDAEHLQRGPHCSRAYRPGTRGTRARPRRAAGRPGRGRGGPGRAPGCSGGKLPSEPRADDRRARRVVTPGESDQEPAQGRLAVARVHPVAEGVEVPVVEEASGSTRQERARVHPAPVRRWVMDPVDAVPPGRRHEHRRRPMPRSGKTTDEPRTADGPAIQRSCHGEPLRSLTVAWFPDHPGLSYQLSSISGPRSRGHLVASGARERSEADRRRWRAGASTGEPDRERDDSGPTPAARLSERLLSRSAPRPDAPVQSRLLAGQDIAGRPRSPGLRRERDAGPSARYPASWSSTTSRVRPRRRSRSTSRPDRGPAGVATRTTRPRCSLRSRQGAFSAAQPRRADGLVPVVESSDQVAGDLGAIHGLSAALDPDRGRPGRQIGGEGRRHRG